MRTRQFGMTLRVATIEDLGFLYRLRNDELTRKWSRTRDELSETEHKIWFQTTSDRILIAAVDGVDVGVTRFVRHPHEIEVSIVIAPEARRKGYAVAMIEAAMGHAWAPVVAYVREDNLASRRAFEKAKFVLDDTYLRFTYPVEEA